MKLSDAASLLNLTGDVDINIIKKAYRKACSKYHPDRNPAGLQMMQAINEAYETLKDFDGSISADEGNENYAQELEDAITAIHALQDVEVEVCGAWVWLGGNTKEHKAAIKAAGFRWASKKVKWYYRPTAWKSAARGNWDMDKIRSEHGSRIIGRKTRTAIAR